MGIPQTPSPPAYPQELQIKLYQAFIFSIPILFSVILLLLFYLFYLKKRASSLSPSPSSTTLNPPPTTLPSQSEMGLKGNLKDKLPIVKFDEDLQARDSQCCVCLGEFEMKEEVNQVPSCRHVFHIDCIRLWLLHSNSTTCPLCRCSLNIITTSPPPKHTLHPSIHHHHHHHHHNNQNPQIGNHHHDDQQQQVVTIIIGGEVNNHSRQDDQDGVPVPQIFNHEGSSSSSSSQRGHSAGQDSVVLTIQSQDTS